MNRIEDAPKKRRPTATMTAKKKKKREEHKNDTKPKAIITKTYTVHIIMDDNESLVCCSRFYAPPFRLFGHTNRVIIDGNDNLAGSYWDGHFECNSRENANKQNAQSAINQHTQYIQSVYVMLELFFFLFVCFVDIAGDGLP